MSATKTPRIVIRSRRRLQALAVASVVLVAAVAAAPLPSIQGEALVGVWEMTVDLEGQQIPATLTVELQDGDIVGTWSSQGNVTPIEEIVVDGMTVTFDHPVGAGDQVVRFHGTVDGDSLRGICTDAEGGEYQSAGQRRDS